jgi:hypothetical protein
MIEEELISGVTSERINLLELLIPCAEDILNSVPKTKSDEYAQLQLNLYGFKEEYKCLRGSEFRDLRRKPGQTGPAARDSARAPKSWPNGRTPRAK